MIDAAVTAQCSAVHTWDAFHVLQPDGHTRLVEPLYCPQCSRPAIKTFPRGHEPGKAYPAGAT